ncbi:methyltransferase [Streptomyces sp. NPDC048209]|uniref:methyltransferase n=1 Tax=Streptomyces sp. NPDC048209 TaxID=3156689 RepID=UPI0034455B2F
MARLSKQQSKAHNQALELVALDRDLTEDEKEFVLGHFQEAATATHNLDGAFFTPEPLARDLSIEVHGDRIIDLCAGIGRLAWSCRDLWGRRWNNEPARDIVCVEKNPDYVTVGRKILPEATWVCADVLTVPSLGLGEFDTAISNPPFGNIARTGDAPGYSGSRFEYHVIAIASTLAQFGAFILPQASAPFRYSGERYYTKVRDRECTKFEQQTRIQLGPGAGFDTSIYADEWRGVSPKVEVAVCDFAERAVRAETAPAPAAPAAPSRKPRPVATLHLPGDAEPSAPHMETLFDLLGEAS